MQPKRVAVYRSELLPASETFIRSQITFLQDWAAVLVGRRREARGLSLDGMDVCIVPPATRTTDAWRERLSFWMDSPAPGLVQAFRSLEVALVHAHFGTNATDVWPSVKAAGLPLLVTLHGYDINIRRDWWETGQGGIRRRAYPHRLLRMARDTRVSFVAVSEAIRQRAIEYGIPSEKIAVAYIGIDTQRFKPNSRALAQRRNRVLFVGRMVAKKAPLLVIRAFAAVRKDIPDAELVMVGDGPLLNEARKLASDLCIPVSFLGAVTPDQVLEQMHETKVFCLPSVVAENGDAEGLPISILEAQSCGVPVVTTEGAANAEGIVGSVGGRLVPENDLWALVSAIKSLLVQPEIPGANHANGFPNRFDISNCTRKLESIYDSVARGSGPTPGAPR